MQWCAPLFLCLSFAVADALHVREGLAAERCFFDGSAPLGARHNLEDMPTRQLHELRVRPGFLDEIRALPEIPKLLHTSFPSHNVVNSKTDMAKQGIRQMIDFNPGWAWKVWNDTEVDAFVAARVAHEDWALLRDSPMIERLDFWRLLLMYCEGGFYQDIDRLYNIPLATLLKPETRMLLPQGTTNFAQDMMCSAPGNPVFDLAIRLNLAGRREAHATGQGISTGRVIDLGPKTYNNAISKVLFGIMLEQGDADRQARFFELVQGLEPFVLTKKESWCHLITSEYPNSDCKWIVREPMYAEFRLAAWDDQIQ